MSSQPQPTKEKKDNWSTDIYSSNAAFVYSSKFTSPVVDLLSPKSGVSSLILSVLLLADLDLTL
jgi:hypothetical protein